MSMGDKQNFIDEYCEKLENDFTIKQMRLIKDKLLSMFDDYQIIKNLTSEIGTEEMVEAYLNAKKVEGRSPNSLRVYKSVINEFLRKVNTPIKDITIYHIRDYFASKKENGVKDTTLSSRRIMLNCFFAWACNEGFLKKNPFVNFGAIKKPIILKYQFSPTEIEKIKNACTTPRNKALVEFLLSTGCRADEVCKLNISDINFAKNEAVVLGKGSKQRKVFVDDICLMYLKEYLETRTDNFEALFINAINTKRLSANGLRNILKRIEKASGVSNVHPHRFRRTFATGLVKRGMKIEEVAAILGHTKLDTTMRYVVLDTDEVHSSYNKFY